MLKSENIYLNQPLANKSSCIKFVQEKLLKSGISKIYCKSIIDREKMASFSIGNMIAVPHGTYEGMNQLTNSTMVIIHLKKPIKWDGDKVQLVIGLAIQPELQIDILSTIAIKSSEIKYYDDLLKIPTIEKFLDFANEKVL